MSNETIKKDNLSRRKFFMSAGTLAFGAIGASALAGCAQTEKTGAKAPGDAAAAYPWPYKKLDVETARKKGHEGYYEGACCYGVFNAIISELGKEVGAPYTTFPTKMFQYGEGGVAGWATLCGALNGAAAAICLVAGEEGWEDLTNELMAWYEKTPFPSDISNKYAQEKAFLVKEMKYDKVLPQSVANSTLCHISVTEWCEKAGLKAFSKERSERCGRLSGDVTAFTVDMLNRHFDKNFVPAAKLSNEVQACRSCHDKGGSLENTRGKMDCLPCHGDPHKQPKS
ncbi:MAG: C-GCAxxG-C-C family (seleno)protein [Thermincolia bacterium]